MNMQWLDWSIVIAVMGIVILTGIYTKRYVQGVADYLSANRCAGRYLLTVAQGMSGLSAASLVANYEKFFQAGFPAYWWQQMLLPVSMIIAVTGFIAYRFRETRALTMAQFFEVRYGRSFRVFSGMVCWFSGIMNYGIFPGVTARLLIHLCGLPTSFTVYGMSIATFPVVMLIMIGIALYLALAGGQIALLVTDFIQGQFSLIVLIGITIFLLISFEWTTIMEALKAVPQNESMLNPYSQSDIKDFSVQFFIMLAVLRFYNFMGWQGSQGYFSSARNPHEAKMAGILSVWRSIVTEFTMVMAPVIAFVVLHHVAFSSDASLIQGALDAIGDPQTRIQMRTPMVIAHIFPVGMIGFFVALVIAAAVSTDDTYLHSWGSIFVQDVLLPFKKKKLSAQQHLKWLRWSVVGTAVFAFMFSMLFPLKDFILMYFQITGTIFLGGGGSVIIGGLYWKRGTAAGAWTAMSSGCVLALLSVILRTWWDVIPGMLSIAPQYPLNGMQASFGISAICVLLYVVVSLLTYKQPFNMEKMLHRGEYAVAGDHLAVHERPSLIWRILGVSKEYSLADKIIASGVTGYALLWVVLFATGATLNASMQISDNVWGQFWYFFTIAITTISFITVIWYVIGGCRDLAVMFRLLRQDGREDAADDGSVS
ncbi:MAG: hypothetical protein WC959_08270 [Kiritimatiellales bacterium]